MSSVKLPEFGTGVANILKGSATKPPPPAGKLKSMAANLKTSGNDIKEKVAATKNQDKKEEKNPVIEKQMTGKVDKKA